MRKKLNLLLIAMVLASHASSPALAQIVSPSEGSSGAIPELTVTSEGLTLQIKRVITMPDKTGYRIVYSPVETKTPGRLVSIVLPAPSLIDDFGNAYQPRDLSGLKYCTRGRSFANVGECSSVARGNFENGQILTLLPGNPAAGTMLFMPVEGTFIQDLANEATTFTLRASLIVFDVGLDKYQVLEFNIANIEVPN